MKIEMKGINKSFFGVPVLKNVDFNLEEGEVHALVGENGAGKSTLVKILTGIYTKDSGKIFIDGKEINLKSVKDSMDLSIAFLQQELTILPEMTIWENIFLGREIKNKFGFLNVKEMKKITKEKLSELNLNIDEDTLAGDLSIGKQQLVQIAASLLWNKKIIILDEPTSALTDKEIDILFKTIKRLVKEKVSFIYISHRLEEIFEICNRVTVLRDGEIIDTKDIGKVKIEDVIQMMVGYEMSDRYPKSNIKRGNTILKVEGLSLDGIFKDISFELHKSEILGFSGLMGSGRTEIMQTIFGLYKKTNGKIFIDDKEVKINNPMKAKKMGIAYITENRKDEGLVLDFSIEDNMILPNLKAILNNLKLVDNEKIQNLTNDYVDKLDIKTDSIKKEVRMLSGGNQQKIVVGKWLTTAPRILILDEPTRGVDVGAKHEIYEIMQELKKNGVAIIMISSELPEIIGMSDRVVVMHEGNLQGIVEKQDLTEERVMTLATGGK
ncbi:MAG: sugar ABC transporter ATP-binding protein [Bacilli bacterium]|nr:sugar ABC transporter ATP-binding protein [Bacilli bacterium]MDD4607895.1 sugar ABC transporter ATP-binding protein [Bacilli bacterium]